MVNRRTFIAGAITAGLSCAITEAQTVARPGRVVAALKMCSDYSDQIAIGQEIHWLDLVTWKDKGIMDACEFGGTYRGDLNKVIGTVPVRELVECEGTFIWRDEFLVYFKWAPHCPYITIDGILELVS